MTQKKTIKIPLLDLSRQHKPLMNEIMDALKRNIDANSFILGHDVAKLEEEFAQYCGAKYGVGCASGTDALYIAMKALDIGPGDEVITVPYTFMATVGAIERTGAKPILVDVEPETFTIDAKLIEKAISPRTKAIIPVHLYGQAADLDAVMEIANLRKLFVIEDCAQAHGATWKGKKVGTFGIISAFSFFPSKNLGAMGDAGICLTDDKALAERMARIRIHGRGSKTESIEKGDNSRIDTLQAAVLRVKLPHLDKWNDERRRAAGWYDSRLKGKTGIRVPIVGKNRTHVYHLYVILADNRAEIIERLNEAGIAWGLHYELPVHTMKGFANLGYKEGDFPISESLCKKIISVPIFPGMTESEVNEVTKAILG